MKTTILLSALFFIGLQSCASVFKGYEDTVRITNPPDSLAVTSDNGVSYNLTPSIVKFVNKTTGEVEEQKTLLLDLPTSSDHILQFSGNNGSEKKFFRRKLGVGWFLLGLIFAAPFLYDAITGNWFYFDDIDLSGLR